MPSIRWNVDTTARCASKSIIFIISFIIKRAIYTRIDRRINKLRNELWRRSRKQSYHIARNFGIFGNPKIVYLYIYIIHCCSRRASLIFALILCICLFVIFGLPWVRLPIIAFLSHMTCSNCLFLVCVFFFLLLSLFLSFFLSACSYIVNSILSIAFERSRQGTMIADNIIF